jgi:wyosine [tRNA(Phe)-imidazoG37] synthetase (radical SAM superfamily)
MELYNADIVLPTLDAYDDASFKKINRPYGTLDYRTVNDGLKIFSKEFQGQLWIELMLIDGMNDDNESLRKYAETLKQLRYDKLYINTPVRPPAESDVKAVDHEKIDHAVDILGGISIDLLESQGFHSEITNHYEAIMSIIKRHPMNQFEIEGFLTSRGCSTIEETIGALKKDLKVVSVNYKGYETYRLK